MALYSVRSGRMFCEQLDHDTALLPVSGMAMTEALFDHSTFSKSGASDEARGAQESLNSFQAKANARKVRNAQKRACKNRRGSGPKRRF